ncbi:hypothetical protein APHAL10511_001352 [Amanita phalloides]|nr:hypothetical protein APHAL10511_001352 [Amanita phalloides]
MVSLAVLDALADPSRVLVQLFDGDLNSFPQKAARHFKDLFASSSIYEEVPVLDVAHPPLAHEDRSLVRFRAMVQDTSFSQEMYLARRSDGGCGGWGLGDIGDALNANAEFDYENLRECHVIWAVSIPGESLWCSDAPRVSNVSAHTMLPINSESHRAHKFPLPNTPHIGVQVKIYDLPPESYKSTDLIEFVGVLTSEPYSGDIEQPSTAFVPTLHVLFSTSLPITIIPHYYPAVSLPDADILRQELLDWLAEEALAGDKCAAEWILLCAIARVQSRHPPILPPTITLSHFPPPHSPSIPTISHVLALIFPLLVTIPISLHILNEITFYPRSNDEDLHSGWLQLPRGTLCVVAEGGIDEGEINAKALSNVHAVQTAMDSQSLQYIFPYSRFCFDTDLSFIVLADGRKSTFFQTYFNVPLHPVSDVPLDELKSTLYKPREAITMPSSEKLAQFRRLVCGAKIGNSCLERSTAHYVQEDYVEERKSASSNNIKSIDSNGLMHRITLARFAYTTQK